jgi:hypothetical protein
MVTNINLMHLYYYNYKIRLLFLAFNKGLINKQVFEHEVITFYECNTMRKGIFEEFGDLVIKGDNDKCEVCKLKVLKKGRKCVSCNSYCHINCCPGEDNRSGAVCLICLMKAGIFMTTEGSERVKLNRVCLYLKDLLNSHFMDINNGNFIIINNNNILTITCDKQFNEIISNYITTCEQSCTTEGGERYYSIFDYLINPESYKYILNNLFNIKYNNEDDVINIIRNFKGQLVVIIGNDQNYDYDIFDFCLIKNAITNIYEFKAFYDIIDKDIHIADINTTTHYHPKISYSEEIIKILNNKPYGEIVYYTITQGVKKGDSASQLDQVLIDAAKALLAANA